MCVHIYILFVRTCIFEVAVVKGASYVYLNMRVYVYTIHTHVYTHICEVAVLEAAENIHSKECVHICVMYQCGIHTQVDRKKSPPPGGFPIYYVPSSRTVCKRTPLEGFVPGSSREALLHTVLDEGTQ